jgi:hypothetical protein
MPIFIGQKTWSNHYDDKWQRGHQKMGLTAWWCKNLRIGLRDEIKKIAQNS